MSTKLKMLDAGMRIALKHCYSNMIRDDIIYEAGVSAGTFHYHFDSLIDYKAKLVEHAIKTNVLEIIGQAIAAKQPGIEKLSAKQKLAALNSLR